MTITSNIAARDALSLRLTGDLSLGYTDTQDYIGEPPYGSLARSPDEILYGHLYKQPDMPTFEDCKALAVRMMEERGEPDLTALLQRFGISRLSDLWIGLWESFYQYAKCALDNGLSPQDGWDVRDYEEL